MTILEEEVEFLEPPKPEPRSKLPAAEPLVKEPPRFDAAAPVSIRLALANLARGVLPFVAVTSFLLLSRGVLCSLTQPRSTYRNRAVPELAVDEKDAVDGSVREVLLLLLRRRLEEGNGSTGFKTPLTSRMLPFR